MFTRQLTPPTSTRRGSALIVAFVFIIALSFVVMRMSTESINSRRSASIRSSVDEASVAAEYGAELAVAALVDGLKVDEPGEDVNSTDRGDYAAVINDWVMGTDGNLTGQRFLVGTLENQQFRVRVRSARQTYAAGGMDPASGWLSEVADFDFENDPLYKYSDIYEITSTAQNKLAVVGEGEAQQAPADRQAQGVTQSVLRIGYSSLADTYKNQLGALHLETPAHFQATSAKNMEIYYPDIRDRGANEYRPDNPANPGTSYIVGGTDNGGYPTLPTPNILITGEDHNLNKYYVEDFQDNKIITPLKLSAEDWNYFGAYGGYWSNGCLTLNYQMDPENANPYRPRTPTFGSGPNDRAMKVLDPNRPADTYLLGGKKSRTVTLNSSGVINETNSAMAHEGGEFNVVLGAFEDLMNLYINMAGITPSNSYPNDGAFADTGQWFRMYIGQYTEGARSSTVSSTSIPLYAGTRIRAQTLHVIKNEKDEVLVREFEKNGTRYNYYVKGSVWNGNYAWADVTFGNEGFWLSSDPSKKKLAVARVFMWQELVGFSLKKRPNGHPYLKDDGSKRTVFALDADGKRIPVGFDEEFQRNAAGNVNFTMTDRFDTINVRQPDGTLKPHHTMDDFLYEKDFGTDDSGTKIKRKALAVFIGYEDQREHQADYNYTDMMFTIYIAPEEKRRVEDIATLGQSALHWWERDEREGLNGRDSQTPMSSNNVVTAGSGMTQADIASANFGLLGYEVGGNPGDEDVVRDNIYTMIDDGKANTVFPRAYFRFENGYSTGELDYEGLQYPDVKKHWDAGVRDYFFARNDVVDFMQLDPEIWIDQINGGWLMDNAVAAMQALAGNIGATLHYIDERWDDDENRFRSAFEDGSASYKVTGREVAARTIAAQLIGYAERQFPTIRTENFAPITDAEAAMKSFGLLAGEMLPAPAAQNYNPLEDGLIDSGETVPHRADEIIMPELLEDGTVRKATVLDFTAATPAEGVAKCYVDYYAGDPLAKADVQAIYGVKEERYSIGFHRSGIDERFKERFGQDHLEYVSLGVKGFNPFRTTVTSPTFIANNKQADSTDEMNRHAVEYKYAADGSAGIDHYLAEYDGAGVPNFVFNDTIDGAGAMVVNGNLVIRDTFAYYGALVVLGDVVIIPTLKEDQYVYGPEGFPIDEYGHALFEDAGGWYYIWENPDNPNDTRKTYTVLDINGDIVKVGEKEGEDENTPGYGSVKQVRPLKEKTYRGELVVQGNLTVKGRVRTPGVANALTGNTDYGKLTVMWSSEALKALSGGLKGQVTASRVSWSNNHGVDADELWRP